MKATKLLEMGKPKRDFDVMIEAIVNVAVMKGMDVKQLNDKEIIALVKAYASEVSEETKRLTEIKKRKSEGKNNNSGLFKKW